MDREEIIRQIVELGGSVNEAASDEALLNQLRRLQQAAGPSEDGPSVPEPDQANLLSLLDQVDAMADADREFDFSTEPVGDAVKPFYSMTDQELEEFLAQNEGMADTAYGAEAETRRLLNERSFLENLLDPRTAQYTVDQHYRQGMSGLTQALDVPGQAAGLYGLLGMGTDMLGVPLPGSEEAINYALERREGVQDFWKLGEPRTMTESLAEIIGMSAPVPGTTGTVRGAGQNLLEVMTPLTIGGGVDRFVVNTGVGYGLEQALREIGSEGEQDTIYDLLGLSEGMRSAAEPINPFIVPTLGLMAGVSLATPMAAHLMSKAKLKEPEVVDLRDLDRRAPENLQTIEKFGDLAKAYLVDTAGALKDIAERAGIPNFKQIQEMFDLDTGLAAKTRINEALSSGRLHTQYGDFTSPVAPALWMQTYKQMPKKLQEDIDTYLKLGDWADDLRLQIQQGVGPENARQLLHQARRGRHQLRQRAPEIAAFSRDAQRITESVRNFFTQGPYAMMSKTMLRDLNRDRHHYVPLNPDHIDPNQPFLHRLADAMQEGDATAGNDRFLYQRNLDEISGIIGRENAVDSIFDYVQSALTAQLNNNIRGAYVDAMANSQFGRQTMRLAKEGEAQKFASRVVDVFRNGEKKRYLATQLVADLLRLDPYAIQHPVALGLFGLRRGFESMTTGPLSITFAPTTAIRDTFAGGATAVAGELGPRFRDLPASFAEMSANELRRSISESIYARIDANQPFPFIDPGAQKQFADSLSNAYYNSIYHLARESGGVSANLHTSRIQTANRAMDEALKVIGGAVDNPVFKALGTLGHGWTTLFEIVSDLPRYAAFRRKIEAGMDSTQAAVEARKIAGDTSKSGQVFNERGRISADAVDKHMMALAPILGASTETLRLSFPWTNPAIQAMRRVYRSASTSPVEFALQSWSRVGLPALAGYAWNEALTRASDGEYDYNRYAMEQRTTRDIAMEIYIGLPGVRPEEGISLPIPHELAFMMSPWLAAVHNMRADNEEIMGAVGHMGLGVLENAFGLATPPGISAAFNLFGQSAPDSLLPPWNSTYSLGEQPDRYLPSNIDAAMRSLWGAQMGTLLDTSYAFIPNMDITDALEEFAAQTIRKAPVIRGLVGERTNVTAFTEMSSEHRRKLEAFYAFSDIWDEFYHPQGHGRVRSSNLPAGPEGINFEIPLANIAPSAMVQPTNPVYELFGQQVRDALATNQQGMTNARARYSVLTQQLRLLRGYNAGRKKDFEEYQQELELAPQRFDEAAVEAERIQEEYNALPHGAKTGTPEGVALRAELDAARGVQNLYEEQMKASQLIDDNEINLRDRYDVNRLISILENERFMAAEQQLAIIKQVEDDITEQLHQQGLLPPGRRFNIETDLGVNPPSYLEALN